MPARERSIFGLCSSGTFGHTTQLSPQWIGGVILVLRLRCHYLQTQEDKSPSIEILYRKISRGLFWGFLEKKGRYASYKIAEPEKALLDWIYFRLKMAWRWNSTRSGSASSAARVWSPTPSSSRTRSSKPLFFPMLEGEICQPPPLISRQTQCKSAENPHSFAL
jgi:hypothetical protein